MDNFFNNLEQSLNNFLQRDVTFIIDRKIIKTGKVILYQVQDFSIIFTLQEHNKRKFYTVPIPFKVDSDAKRTSFSYKLSDIEFSLPELKKNKDHKPSKMHDQTLNIIWDTLY